MSVFDIEDAFRNVLHDPDNKNSLELIHTLRVSPPEHSLLTSFVRFSVDPEATAVIGLRAQDVDAHLANMTNILHFAQLPEPRPRLWGNVLGSGCALPAQIVPGDLLSALESHPSLDHLSVFLTQEHLDIPRQHLYGSSVPEQLRNTWTLRHDVAEAFANGQVELRTTSTARSPDRDGKSSCYDEG
ncbi:uncharacterized protein L3040_004101 [Drepanopeziza brunnea f. sp. 'multigermtubi']|uniref:uncharacterized protein n=1 Tax=Drepanopeziza brunnea f. sp. 'multigermtubi' TaxID=698441 RepID=UPI00238A5BDF|nr:hypothetical protein L3040_004101 [Drepanopeziza brunnea f. sp. 'multigermtubi']